MLNYRVTTRRCELSPGEQANLERHIERIEQRLPRLDPDLAHISIGIEKHARRDEYLGDIRLVIMNRSLTAKRNSGPTANVLLNRAFEDIEQELERFLAGLRHDSGRQRADTALEAERLRFREPERLEQPEVWASALAGDRTAFEALIEPELPSLRNAITQTLRVNNDPIDADEVERALGAAITTAFAEIREKPLDWSFGGWLAWQAQRLIRRDRQDLPRSGADAT